MTVIEFIESNLSTEINPDMIAKKHFVSLSQLYRDPDDCLGDVRVGGAKINLWLMNN